MTPRIYADHNATTPLTAAAAEAMHRAVDRWGNPSSAHQAGREAAALLREARETVAEACGVGPNQVVFTSGGSESNSFALLGKYFSAPDFSLLTSPVEHSSVQDTAKFLETRARVLYAPVSPRGEIDLDWLATQLREAPPSLVSLMTANNETGVLFPVAEIADLCRAAGVLFHTDAVQAFGKISREVWGKADLVSISAHKVGGPKGVGALIFRPGIQLSPLHYGGSQEVKRRGGTENLLGAVGFAAAITEAAGKSSSVGELRDRFENRLAVALDGVRIQGQGVPRLENTSNVRFEGVSSEVLLSVMDLDGVCLSAGSACSAGSIRPSHVLLAMGLSPEAARQCLRVSFGDSNTLEEVDRVAELMVHHVGRIRSRAPRTGSNTAPSQIG